MPPRPGSCVRSRGGKSVSANVSNYRSRGEMSSKRDEMSDHEEEPDYSYQEQVESRLIEKAREIE